MIKKETYTLDLDLYLCIYIYKYRTILNLFKIFKNAICNL